jgi:hypothetical protein
MVACIRAIEIPDYCRYTVGTMMLKQMISFTEAQISFIKSESSRLGISIAELGRRIVDAYREQ